MVKVSAGWLNTSIKYFPPSKSTSNQQQQTKNSYNSHYCHAFYHENALRLLSISGFDFFTILDFNYLPNIEESQLHQFNIRAPSNITRIPTKFHNYYSKNDKNNN